MLPAVEVVEEGFVPQFIGRRCHQRNTGDFIMFVGAVRPGEVANKALLPGDLAREAHAQLVRNQGYIDAATKLEKAVIAGRAVEESGDRLAVRHARREDHRAASAVLAEQCPLGSAKHLHRLKIEQTAGKSPRVYRNVTQVSDDGIVRSEWRSLAAKLKNRRRRTAKRI